MSKSDKGMVTPETIDDYFSGKWVRPVHQNFIHACCDCAEVARMEFRVVEHNGRPAVEFRMFRDDTLTDRFRQDRRMRHKIIDMAHSLACQAINEAHFYLTTPKPPGAA